MRKLFGAMFFASLALTVQAGQVGKNAPSVEVKVTEAKEIKKAKALTKAEITVKFKRLSGWNAEITAVEDSPVRGYYQIITDGRIFYLADSGDHLFIGELFGINGGWKNFTEPRLMQARREMIEKNSTGYVEYKALEEKYQIYVFTDPTCGYCNLLHGRMAEYNKAGITVRYLAWPRGGITPNPRAGGYSPSYLNMKRAWCSDDVKSDLDKLFAKNNLTVPVCENSVVDAHYKLGKKFGVTGTPAIVLPSGNVQRGYLSPADLLKVLGE